jgi:hypothetical protein
VISARRVLQSLKARIRAGIRRGIRMTTDQIDLTNREQVEDFVSRSDALGGPDAAPTQDYLRHVECVVPGWLRATARNFDPLSDGYFDVQEQLYASIAGKPYLGLASELTEFDKESAVRSLTAYPGRTLRRVACR